LGASVTSDESKQKFKGNAGFQGLARSLSGESLPETGEPRELIQEVAVVQEKISYKGVAFKIGQNLTNEVPVLLKDKKLLNGP